MSDGDDILAALLEPESDRAWKVAAGHVIYTTLEEVRRTNGRVTSLERWRDRIIGAISIMLALPTIAALAIGLTHWEGP